MMFVSDTPPCRCMSTGLCPHRLPCSVSVVFANSNKGTSITYVHRPPYDDILCTRQVVPAGSRLKRRRSWDLFLEPADCPEVAVLVINKKSSFTLDDAHTTLALMEEEVAARRQPCSSNPLRQLLLATRAGVAPAADVFIRGMQDRSSSENCATVVVQWEQLAGLVEDRTLGRFLDGSTELLRKPAAFALPQWLADERERERRAGGKRLFELRAPFEPAGDQPEAIEALARGLAEGKRHQTLLGATGTVRRQLGEHTCRCFLD